LHNKRNKENKISISIMKKTCLNGWWDFYPVYEKNNYIDIPAQGWLEKAYLVPSVWLKPLDCVKKGNEEHFHQADEQDLQDIENLDFLFDDYNYPKKWTLTKEAWVRTKFEITNINDDSDYFLLLEAVMPYSKVYLNGKEVSYFMHPTLPNQINITDYIIIGENKLVIHIFDYEKDEFGRYMTPTGTMMIADNAGVWQDVFIIEKSKISIKDCCIRTYLDNMCFQAKITISNSSFADRNIEIKSYILDTNKKDRKLEFKNQQFKINSSEEINIMLCDAFPTAELWEPANPKLYFLKLDIYENGLIIQSHIERFGFREVRIENKNILLNNHPVHLFSDWGHKLTTYCYTNEWIISWFRMIKEGNMNHTRLHTCPHPKNILNIADEMGILITAETGLHGSGGYQASNSEDYWINAYDHVRRFINRDKNHPSVIMWSVENEMRWNQKGDEQKYPEKIITNLPKLKKLINDLDPTRPAYHEGDSSLWDESEQDIISRHYGKDAVGADWWDETKPLHVGEMALYHYEGPNTAVNLIGDKAYVDHANVDKASAIDAKMLIEYGRTRGICCFGPWNQSCHKLIRTEKKDRYIKYPDYSVPGIKPLVIRAHTSEFNFWEKGRNYTVQKSFDIQAEAFRPFALIDYSLKNGYFKDEKFLRTLYIVNDTKSDKAGILTVKFGYDTITEKHYFVRKGYVERVDLIFNAYTNNDDYISNIDITYEFTSDSIVLDKQIIKVHVYNMESINQQNLINKINKAKISVYGNEILSEKLQKSGIKCIYFKNLDDINNLNTDILILAKNSVKDNDTIHKQIELFLNLGIKILIMEQNISLFKNIKLTSKPMLTSFKTNMKDMFNNINDDQLRFWGNDPYAKIASDSYVASHVYEKSEVDDDVSYILETGEGSFGRGDLSFSTLLMLKYGKSVLIANQMNITDNLNIIPQANHLIISILFELCLFKKADRKAYVLESNEFIKFNNIKDDVLNGACLVVNNLSDCNIDKWNDLLGSSINLIEKNDIYNCKIKKKDRIVESISNYELCGINTFSYSRKDAKNYSLCDYAIKKSKGLNFIIESCENSMMKELFVYGGHTELRRAYTISKYSYNKPKTQEYALIASIKYGNGTIYFNQLKKDIDDKKHNRMLKRILSNLQGCPSGSIFNFDKTENNKFSEGFPVYVNTSKVLLDDVKWFSYCATTKNNNERMAHKKTVSIGNWTLIKLDSLKCYKNDIYQNYSCLITFNIFSSEPRKNSGSNLGIPNPEDLTFLHVTTSGSVRLAVNGYDYGMKNTIDNQCMFSDISLEKGINYIMLAWTPDNIDSDIKLVWKNINLKPETNLEFYT